MNVDPEVQSIDGSIGELYDRVSKLAQISGIGLTWHWRLGRRAFLVNVFKRIPQGLPRSYRGIPIVYRAIGKIVPERL
jgi:hypothetical protein